MPARLAKSRMTTPTITAALVALAGHAWGSMPEVAPSSALTPSSMQAPSPGLAPSPGRAQPIEDAISLVDPGGFDAISLPLTPVAGQLAFSAARTWSWSSPATTAGATTTQRLVLDGDCRLVIGSYEFRARRAAIWLQRMPGSSPSRPVYQIYAVLQHATTPEAAAAVGIDAEWLPIEGVISTTSSVVLRVDARADGRPQERDVTDFLNLAEQEFSSRLAIVAGLAERVAVNLPIDLPDPPTTRVTPEVATLKGPRDPRRAAEASPIFPSAGIFYFSVGERMTIRGGPESNSLTLTGGVVAQYADAKNGRSLELTADRAVVFFKPGRLADTIGKMDADDLQGLYLEGAVTATDGAYTLRSPRIYYDVATSRSIVLDAVFWTTEEATGMPLYVRADALRQEASDQFSADRASLSNTAFFKPHFSVGASDLTIRVNPQDRNGVVVGGRAMVNASNITMQGQGTPFFWFPRFKGDPENFPLKDIRFTDSNKRGAGVRTKWNAMALLGIQPPPGVNADLQLDYFEKAGIALGLATSWNRINHHGKLYLYGVPEDNGSDVMSNGREIDADGAFRGLVRFEQVWRPTEQWLIRIDGSHVSDTRFIESYFSRIANDGRELTNRLHAQRTEGQTQFTAQVKATSLDFIPNQNLMQSPGYAVDKLPELRFGQITSDVFDRTRPGLLTHTWDMSYAQMRLRFSEVQAAEYGFVTDPNAQAAFGTNADESLGDALRATGLNEDLVNRFDTRHEFAAPVALGRLNITPFLVGRFTAWDSSFDDFSPNEEESSRVWVGGGARLATQLQTVNNSIDSRLFDVHRTRHIIEPSVTFWTADSSINSADLPVYDDDVENLAEGSMIRVGLDQTWQTKRGGAGRWRSVDLFTLDAEYVWASDRADRGAPIGRYYDPRPELSRPGEFARVAAAWQTTEIISIAGETIHDFGTGKNQRSSVGLQIQHTDRFSTVIDARMLETQDVTYGGWSASYRLTDKYRASFNTTYDVDEGDFRNFSTQLYRSFPVGTLGLTLNYNNTRGETSFGFILRPFGLREPAAMGLGAGSDRFGG
ncbi:MAG: hypothetical protein ACI89L_001063 [Phycisphaerales bacterium]|jgi:hypothetical protein